MTIGDELLVQGNNELTPAKVINVSITIMQGSIFVRLIGLRYFLSVIYCSIETGILFLGAYVPLTTNGKIIVDGVLASCFANSHHDVAYSVMIPIQKFSEVMDLIFGIEDGFPVFVSSARQLGKLLLPESQFRLN